MGIKRYYHRRSIFGMRMACGSGNDGLVAKMDAVEHADGKEKRAV